MFGAFSTGRGAALYLLAWLVLAVVLAGFLAGAAGAPWPNALLFALPATLVYGFAAGFSSLYLCRANPLGATAAWRVAAVLGGAALFAAFAWTTAALAWDATLATVDLGTGIAAPVKAMLFGLAVALFVLAVMANYLVIEFDRTRTAERRELQLRLTAQDAELRMLRTQVDPHFLFNSLNSISALTASDPRRAREMTLQLSEFFRQSLGLDAQRRVPLRQELTLLRHFFAIEQVRFGERLRVDVRADDDALDCLVPPMILQPLAENAVKHGIGGLPEGGTVAVRASRDGSRLRIEVENAMDEDAPARGGQGIGLANVRQRLAAAHGHEAYAHWQRTGGAFKVELALPAETEES